MAKKFRVTYSIDVVLVVLETDDIWPDDDAPENPTAADVAARIRKDGGFPDVIGSWNLDSGLHRNNFDVFEEP